MRIYSESRFIVWVQFGSEEKKGLEVFNQAYFYFFKSQRPEGVSRKENSRRLGITSMEEMQEKNVKIGELTPLLVFLSRLFPVNKQGLHPVFRDALDQKFDFPSGTPVHLASNGKDVYVQLVSFHWRMEAVYVLFNWPKEREIEAIENWINGEKSTVVLK